MFRTTFTYLLLLLCCDLSAQQLPLASQQLKNSVSLAMELRGMDSLSKLHEAGSVSHTAGLYNVWQSEILPKGARPVLARDKPVQKKDPYNISYNRTGPSLYSKTCYTISGRDFLRQDSLIMWASDPVFTADGNVLISGEYGHYEFQPYEYGGFCMKTDREGNMIWGKLFDSTAGKKYDFLNLIKVLELKNGNIMLGGRTDNSISGNSDVVLMKLDANGNMLWSKTYASRFWQGFNGSGDYFGFRSLEEDPATGDIYFLGSHWGSGSAITKIDPADGRVIWSNEYKCNNTERPFGMIINSNDIQLFQLEFGYLNDAYIWMSRIKKTDGDTISTRTLGQILSPQASPGIYGAFELVRMDNGHFKMSGPTTRFSEIPVYTGTVDLQHAAVIEVDEQFNFVDAFVWKNRVESNMYNTKVSLYPDGSGLFTMMKFVSGYKAEAEVVFFKDDLIYHQRKRIHINEGLPYEPRTLQLEDGGLLNIKVMGDSTAAGLNNARIDYARLHTSDTASQCLGMPTKGNFLTHFQFQPVSRTMEHIGKNVFSESRVKKYDSWDVGTYTVPSCQVISHCDTLNLEVDAATICTGGSVLLTTHKNKECGSLVPLAFSSSLSPGINQLTDTTYSLQFTHAGTGYIYGSLMGCELQTDSVLVTINEARHAVDLGKDTVICPSNRVVLNAGKGFATYEWQDGSTDSVFTVIAPGKYYVTVTNGCGGKYSDTIEVAAHPPISLSIGNDRTKCNNDTVRITAPPGFISYSWSADYNISSLTEQEVIVNPVMDTMYKLRAEKEPGCFAYDSVRITVHHSPPIYLGGDTAICRYDSIVLDPGPGFISYSWNTGSMSDQLVIDQPGTYSIKAMTTEGCYSVDTLVLLSLYDLPKPYLGPDSVLCAGTIRLLQTNGQYASYLWNTGAATSTISVQQPGDYWLSVTDLNGCYNSDTMRITSIVRPPAAFLGADTEICSYGQLLLKPLQSFNAYHWSNGANEATVSISQPGIYWLDATDHYHCTGRDSIVVTKKDCQEGLFVPTAFTPNKDGLNDTFLPLLFGDIISFRFQVFNRWGQIIFQTTTPGKGWDGTFKGLVQDSNVFIWNCVYQLNGKKEERQSGKVLLIR